MKPDSFVRMQSPTAARALAVIDGLTVIELVVVLAIAAILTAVAVPAYNSFVLSKREAALIDSLASSFNYARSEAVKHNLQGGVTVCPSLDGATCGGTAWSGGWVVVDALGHPPLQKVAAPAESITVTARGSATGVTFQSNGWVTPAILTAITVCDNRGAAHALELEVNSTGRVIVSHNPGQTVAGATLTCPKNL